ncbi:MAG: hypothetical protein H7Z40_22730, partial [Phycisphaerae bacterium]|nr:hypothetical protein [Gemmatimonadaceae bacterium]
MKTSSLLRAVAATAAVCALAAPSVSAAQAGKLRPSMIVSTAWLADHAKDANLVVLHVGNKAQYDSAHVPGARFVSLADVTLGQGESKLSTEFPTPARLKAWAEGLGIGNNTRVVVVPNDSILQIATRVFLTLAYMGAMERTSLLNGG